MTFLSRVACLINRASHKLLLTRSGSQASLLRESVKGDLCARGRTNPLSHSHMSAPQARRKLSHSDFREALLCELERLQHRLEVGSVILTERRYRSLIQNSKTLTEKSVRRMNICNHYYLYVCILIV